MAVTLNDAHCHFFSRAFFEGLGRLRGDAAPDAAAITRELGMDDPGPPEALADRWAAELDRNGVSRAALIASAPGDEPSVAAALVRHPSRFVGFFMLDPTSGDAPARVRRALADGLRVAALFPAMHRYPLHDSRVDEVADALAETPGTALFVHCGVLSIGARRKLGIPSRFEMRYGNPIDLQGVASRHPSLPVIVPHFGAGFFRELLMVADSCPNVHADTSSSNGWIRYSPELTLERVFERALDVLGPKRLLFGTDSSWFPRGWQRPIHDAQARVLAALGVDDSTKAAVFGGNFDRLFPAA